MQIEVSGEPMRLKYVQACRGEAEIFHFVQKDR